MELRPLTHLFEDCLTGKQEPRIEPTHTVPSHTEQLKALLRDIKQKVATLERLVDANQPNVVCSEGNSRAWPEEGLRHRVVYEHKPLRVIEGVFDGECMIDAEGNRHNVPQNYASKSRLVEGDMMQLMFMPEGKMLYRQVERVERATLRGYLKQENGRYACEANGRCYFVSHASVTYWRVKPGDHMIIAVPKNGESAWAAVETV